MPNLINLKRGISNNLQVICIGSNIGVKMVFDMRGHLEKQQNRINNKGYWSSSLKCPKDSAIMGSMPPNI